MEKQLKIISEEIDIFEPINTILIDGKWAKVYCLMSRGIYVDILDNKTKDNKLDYSKLDSKNIVSTIEPFIFLDEEYITGIMLSIIGSYNRQCIRCIEITISKLRQLGYSFGFNVHSQNKVMKLGDNLLVSNNNTILYSFNLDDTNKYKYSVAFKSPVENIMSMSGDDILNLYSMIVYSAYKKYLIEPMTFDEFESIVNSDSTGSNSSIIYLLSN